MNKLIIAILTLSLFSAKAQNNKQFSLSTEVGVFSKTTSFEQTRLNSPVTTKNVLNYLETRHNAELELSFYNESPVAQYFLFQQTHNSIQVYGAELKITVNNKGIIIREDNGLLDIPIHFKSNFIEPLGVISQLAKGRSIVESTKTQKFLLNNNQFHSVYEYKISFTTDEYELYLIDNTGKVLLKRDLNLYHASAEKDTLAQLVIFQPDPLTKAHKNYGGIYKDLNDQNTAVLDPLRDTVSMNVSFDDVSKIFKLENDYCKIAEFSSPVQPIVTSTTPFFEYSRSHHGFEQVNAYYHINNTQNHVQSLGFNNLVNYKIEVDVNALNGSDNSMFSSSSNPPRLFFGEGGVDDAEDSDVVIHEYGHAISHSANGGSNNGSERETLDEAFGDYLCSSYSKMIDPFNWYNVFTWDGHNEFWSGRSGLNSMNKMYPVVFGGNIYEHTDLWVCAVMEINDKIGRQTTDQLAIEALYGYFSGMSFSDAAMLIVQADSLYNSGNNVFVIWNVFYDKGILPANLVSIDENGPTNIEVWGTSNFAQGGELNIMFNSNLSGTALIYDATGRFIEKLAFNNQTELNISGELYKSGLYILKLETKNGNIESFKLLRN